MYLKSIGFSLAEIKEMTTPQVQLYLQRSQEPVYKAEVDREVMKAKEKE